MNDLKKFILNILKSIQVYLNRFYNKMYFIFNKQKTIQNMFKPIVDNKIAVNNILQTELVDLKKRNSILKNKINQLIKDNKITEEKIAILQDLLIKRP